VWHEFPQEPLALGLDTQFLLGPSLMICPVLKEALTSRECYFPKGIWYEGFDLRIRPGSWLEGTGAQLTLHLPLNRTGVFFRGGSIIIGQDVGRNSEQSRLLPMTVHVFLDQDEKAEGQLYLDDGSSIDPVETEAYSLATMEFHDHTLSYKLSKNVFSSGTTVRNVWVAGLHQPTSGVLVDGTDWETWQEVEENGSYYVHLTELPLTVDTEFSVVLIPK